MDILLAFFYIFNFRLLRKVAFSSSIFLVAIYLMLRVVTSFKVNRSIGRMLFSKYNIYITLYMFILMSFSLIVPFFHETSDFTFFTTLVHQFICIEVGIMLVGYYKCKYVRIIDVIIDAFFAQSLIQILCFISPNILGMTDVFRSENTIFHRESSYIGFRGLAISGSGFFGLAVAYAVIFVIIAFYWNYWRKANIIKIIYVFALGFGALSAGRTSIIGLLFFVVIFFLNNEGTWRGSKKTNLLFGFIIIVLILGLMYRLVLFDYLNSFPGWIRFSKYITQLFGDGKTGMRISNVTSLKNMFDNMYFRLTPKQILFGDGKYIEDGFYYLHTDVGFMRNILFWGIFGTILLYFFSVMMVTLNSHCKLAKKISYFIILMGVVLELKGQVMGILIIFQSIIVLLSNGFDDVDKSSELIGNR